MRDLFENHREFLIREFSLVFQAELLRAFLCAQLFVHAVAFRVGINDWPETLDSCCVRCLDTLKIMREKRVRTRDSVELGLESECLIRV